MPQLDFSGADSKISADKIQGQSGTTVTVPTGHKIAGTDANSITINGVNAVAVAHGTSGNVLTSTGSAWASSTPAGGGAWTLIESTSITSAVALVDITGLTSTYDTYACIFADIKVATDGAGPRLRLGDASGIDTGGSDYSWIDFDQTSSNASGGTNANASTDEIRAGDVDCGNASGEGMGGMFFIYNPTDTTIQTILSGTTVAITNSGLLQVLRFAGRRTSAIAIDRVRFYLNTGNIASGRFTVWGIAHA